MADEKPKEPLEGLQITDYDESNEIVTIEIHRSLLNNPKSIEALQQRMVDIIKGGPSVAGVKVKPRKI